MRNERLESFDLKHLFESSTRRHTMSRSFHSHNFHHIQIFLHIERMLRHGDIWRSSKYMSYNSHCTKNEVFHRGLLQCI